MKTTNLSSKSFKQLKSESQNLKDREQGITRRLLEKYKPKHHCSMENISERNDKKRVA